MFSYGLHHILWFIGTMKSNDYLTRIMNEYGMIKAILNQIILIKTILKTHGAVVRK